MTIVLATNGQRFTQIRSLTDKDFLPGILKYRGLDGLLTSVTREPTLVLANTQENEFELAQQAADKNNLSIQELDDPAQLLETVKEWLLRQHQE